MPQPLREAFPSNSSPTNNSSLNGTARPVMAYLCECGTKWCDSTTLLWNCKCGRPLTKRNGIIHEAIAARHRPVPVTLPFAPKRASKPEPWPM